MSRVVGVAGRTASGKDTVADYLVEAHGYTKITVSDILKEIAGTNVKEELTHFQKELREDDPHAVGKLVIDKINELDADKITIAGVRSIAEWEIVAETFENAALVFVHVDDEERFRRVEERGRAGDPETFEEFQKVDAFEESEFDYEKLSDVADITVDNTSLSIDEFHEILDSQLTKDITGKSAANLELYKVDLSKVSNYNEGPTDAASPEHAITKVVSRIRNRDKAVYLKGTQYLFGEVNSARSAALKFYRDGDIKVSMIDTPPVREEVEEVSIKKYSPSQLELFDRDSAESLLLVPTRDKGDTNFRNPNYFNEPSGHRPFLLSPDRKSPQREKPDKGDTKHFFFGPAYPQNLKFSAKEIIELTDNQKLIYESLFRKKFAAAYEENLWAEEVVRFVQEAPEEEVIELLDLLQTPELSTSILDKIKIKLEKFFGHELRPLK